MIVVDLCEVTRERNEVLLQWVTEFTKDGKKKG